MTEDTLSRLRLHCSVPTYGTGWYGRGVQEVFIVLGLLSKTSYCVLVQLNHRLRLQKPCHHHKVNYLFAILFKKSGEYDITSRKIFINMVNINFGV